MSAGVPDESWAGVARDARDALAILGWPIEARCLPGEPGHGACGHDYAAHALAHLVQLQVIAEHQLKHLGAPADLRAIVTASARAGLDCECRTGAGR